MPSITPCRTLISDRFPVASFVVKVPEARCFEVAYATDPNLFLPEWRDRRRPENFYSTRSSGLLRAPSGETTVLLPAEQLRRFRGAERVYYAVASFAEPSGGDPRFTLAPHTLQQAPFIQLSPGFSGRGLGRSRFTEARPLKTYGGHDSLTWGGDLAAAAASAPPAPPSSAPHASVPYDDGYDPSLWSDPQAYGGRASYGYVFDPREVVQARGAAHPDDYGATPAPTRALGLPSGEPEGLAEPPSTPMASAMGTPSASARSLGEPPGLAEPPGHAEPSRAAYGGRAEPSHAAFGGHAEPRGYEDPSELAAARYGRPTATEAAPAHTAPVHTAPPTAPAPAKPAAPHAPPTPKIPLHQAVPAILGPVVQAHTAEAYGRHGTDARGGLTWGIGHFSESDGLLRRVLDAANRRDQAWSAGKHTPLFDQVFGPHRAAALREWIRNPTAGDHVDSERLTAPSWREGFARAARLHLSPPEGIGLPGQEDPFKAAQNEVLLASTIERYAELARALGLDTVQGLALLVDILIELGHEHGPRWLQAVGSSRPAGVDPVQHLLSASADQPNATRLRSLAHATRDHAGVAVELIP